jgi:hypothetical protein
MINVQCPTCKALAGVQVLGQAVRCWQCGSTYQPQPLAPAANAPVIESPFGSRPLRDVPMPWYWGLFIVCTWLWGLGASVLWIIRFVAFWLTTEADSSLTRAQQRERIQAAMIECIAGLLVVALVFTGCLVVADVARSLRQLRRAPRL